MLYKISIVTHKFARSWKSLNKILLKIKTILITGPKETFAPSTSLKGNKSFEVSVALASNFTIEHIKKHKDSTTSTSNVWSIDPSWARASMHCNEAACHTNGKKKLQKCVVQYLQYLRTVLAIFLLNKTHKASTSTKMGDPLIQGGSLPNAIMMDQNCTSLQCCSINFMCKLWSFNRKEALYISPIYAKHYCFRSI